SRRPRESRPQAARPAATRAGPAKNSFSRLSPATGETEDGDRAEHEENPGAPYEAQRLPVGGAVTEADGVGAAERQAPQRVTEDREWLVVGDGLHPAGQ